MKTKDIENFSENLKSKINFNYDLKKIIGLTLEVKQNYILKQKI